MTITYTFSDSASFGVYANVTKGNIIYATDFTNVGQPATKGNKISNSYFTAGNTITASGFNSVQFPG